MISRAAGAILLAAALLTAGCRMTCPAPSSSVHSPPSSTSQVGPSFGVTETNDVLRVTFGAETVAEYRFRDVSRPFLYPLLGPGGLHMTRRWPQDDVPGEERDHPHHHGLMWAHGAANGVDFWSEGPEAGRMVHQYFVEHRPMGDTAVIATRNRWLKKDGTIVGEDERRMVFHRPAEDQRVVDFEITIFASKGDLTLGDTKEGSFAIRLAESMRVKQPQNKPGAGSIVNSRGQRDGEAWGKAAEWCDYSGPVEGQTMGVAIFDHPANPRHPTRWHVRDYGLFAVNPFGLHDFDKAPPGTGDLKIPAASNLTFRYRVVLHRGDVVQAKIADQYTAYRSASASAK
jgi:hypothetical protein